MAGVRYSVRHTMLRAGGGPVPLACPAGATAPLPRGPLAHRNTLPQSAFDLPEERFGAQADLIECVQAAAAAVTGSPASVVSPVGSIVYARRDGDLLWDLVHDADVWVYVPGAALAGRSLHQWHVALQIRLHREFRSRGVRSTLTWANRYVNLRDDEGRLRMVELKIAPLEWLGSGLDRVHLRFCGVRARRGVAYSLRPRVEWAAYSAFENHYATPAATPDFAARIAALHPEAVLRGLRFVYHENLAAALRRFGPAHVAESHLSPARLARNRRGVLKKLLMLSVLARDPRGRLAVLTELEHPLPTADPVSRRALVARTVADLAQAGRLPPDALGGWLSPAVTATATAA